MSYFRALIFCTQTSVNPLRQTILPLRGTAVNKQWIFKKPILSKLRSCGLLLISFPPVFQANTEEDRPAGKTFSNTACIEIWTLRDGVLFLWDSWKDFISTFLEEQDVGILSLRWDNLNSDSRSKARAEFWVWSLDFLHLLAPFAFSPSPAPSQPTPWPISKSKQTNLNWFVNDFHEL